MEKISIKLVITYLRLALGASFLSAVADRFGLWGEPGEKNVAWGNLEDFMAYVGQLTPFVPDGLNSTLGWVATIGELVLGILLIIGFKTKIAAFLSGLLLLMFALGMVAGAGIKAPFDNSVFSASAGALLLMFAQDIPYSLDSILKKRTIKSTE